MKRTSTFIQVIWLAGLGSFLSCQNADPKAVAANPTNTVATGTAIFTKNCKLCHGADGRLGLNGAKDLTISQLSLNERVNIITNGKNMMAPFGKLLTPQEIDSVAAYTLHFSPAVSK